jgi:phosphoglycolate phosphatase
MGSRPFHEEVALSTSQPIQPLRAVVFDFDGTLADSYPGITASVNHVRAAHGLPPLSELEVRHFVGRGPANLLAQTVPGADIPRDVARYRAHHPSVMKSGTRLLPGAAEVLAALKGQGLLLAVCSNKLISFTRELLDYLGVSACLDVVLGPEDVPHAKPAPDMLLAALDRLHVQPGEALYIGDMTVDIETARGAGVRVWVVPTGSNDAATLAAAHPDRLLQDLRELPGLLQSLGGAI